MAAPEDMFGADRQEAIERNDRTTMTTLVFVHGIKAGHDHSGAEEALSLALSVRGAGGLEDRGLRFAAIKWLTELEGPEPDADPGPPELTDVKSGRAKDRERARGDWLLAQAALERHLMRRHSYERGPYGLPGDGALDVAAEFGGKGCPT